MLSILTKNYYFNNNNFYFSNYFNKIFHISTFIHSDCNIAFIQRVSATEQGFCRFLCPNSVGISSVSAANEFD
ncbi:hypothetical protein B4168_3877 [Anoxybacillus flavithermus]|nr:hypothetical protein B4168_3877 [Anoxybacillus flavithermus]OAO87938.1 hypothetical protein GT23_0671 [Parageobacillus thermoglucosidasius]